MRMGAEVRERSNENTMKLEQAIKHVRENFYPAQGGRKGITSCVVEPKGNGEGQPRRSTVLTKRGNRVARSQVLV